VKCRPAWVGH